MSTRIGGLPGKALAPAIESTALEQTPRLVLDGERLNYEQGARYLGLVDSDGRPKVSTLRSMVHRKQVPYVRISGRIVVFERSALDAFLAARRVAWGGGQ